MFNVTTYDVQVNGVSESFAACICFPSCCPSTCTPAGSYVNERVREKETYGPGLTIVSVNQWAAENPDLLARIGQVPGIIRSILAVPQHRATGP